MDHINITDIAMQEKYQTLGYLAFLLFPFHICIQYCNRYDQLSSLLYMYSPCLMLYCLCHAFYWYVQIFVIRHGRWCVHDIYGITHLKLKVLSPTFFHMLGSTLQVPIKTTKVINIAVSKFVLVSWIPAWGSISHMWPSMDVLGTS